MPIIFFLTLLTFLTSANFHTAQAQQTGKVPQIGLISPRDPGNEASRSEAIWLALRELGYIEGQNIAIEYRYAEGKVDRLPELAAELVRLKVDIILVVGDPAIRAAKKCGPLCPARRWRHKRFCGPMV